MNGSIWRGISLTNRNDSRFKMVPMTLVPTLTDPESSPTISQARTRMRRKLVLPTMVPTHQIWVTWFWLVMAVKITFSHCWLATRMLQPELHWWMGNISIHISLVALLAWLKPFTTRYLPFHKPSQRQQQNRQFIWQFLSLLTIRPQTDSRL